jgi:hypothetical protein
MKEEIKHSRGISDRLTGGVGDHRIRLLVGAGTPPLSPSAATVFFFGEQSIQVLVDPVKLADMKQTVTPACIPI